VIVMKDHRQRRDGASPAGEHDGHDPHPNRDPRRKRHDQHHPRLAARLRARRHALRCIEADLERRAWLGDEAPRINVFLTMDIRDLLL
jgi:hypothetical protein